MPDKTPSERITLEISSRFRMADLNGDCVSDLIVWHPGRTPERTQCSLLISSRETAQ